MGFFPVVLLPHEMRTHATLCPLSPSQLVGTLQGIPFFQICFGSMWFFLYNHGATMWAVGIFIFVWTCAILGTALTFRKIKSHSYFKTACYVLMGLTILVAFKPLYDSVGLKVVLLIIAEGLSYIIGAVFYSFKKTKYMHFVFHVFVVLGDVFHMLAVWNVIS